MGTDLAQRVARLDVRSTRVPRHDPASNRPLMTDALLLLAWPDTEAAGEPIASATLHNIDVDRLWASSEYLGLIRRLDAAGVTHIKSNFPNTDDEPGALFAVADILAPTREVA